MKRKIWISAVLAVVASLGACGKNDPAPTSDRGVEKEPLSGTLSQNVENVLQGRYRDACETKHQKLQQEIAKALDARSKEIEELAPKLYESASWKVVPLGKTFVRERKTEPRPKAGWQTDDSENWEQIYENYQKIKDQPTNQDWVWLSGDVKSILVDDRDRAINHSNYYLGKDDAPVLQSISQTIAKCLVDSSCGALSFSEAETKYIQGSPFYAEKFKSVDSGSERLDVL